MRTKSSASSKSAPSKKKPAKRQAHEQQPSPPGFLEQKESQEEKIRQQTLLNVFNTAFRDVLYSPDFATRLQEVKTALYNRDFAAAFAHESALAVYAARWSPTRALCYGHILRSLDAHLKTLITANSAPPETHASSDEEGAGNDNDDQTSTNDPGLAQVQNGTSGGSEPRDPTPEGKDGQRVLRVLSIGGAAAELVAVVDYLASISTSTPSHSQSQTTPTPEITLLDIAPWKPIINTLTKVLAAPKSPYKAPKTQTQTQTQPQPQTQPPIPPPKTTITQTNILTTDLKPLLSQTAGPRNSPLLITLLFTLNELYTTSGIKPTTSFLRALTTYAPAGSLLLIVDSPGSYAETAVGKDGRRYPMQWLLHHTLVPPEARPSDVEGQSRETGVRWERLESTDSVWFRVADGLRYPIPLENMRYQLHLYRACVGS